jgi:molybdopterin converting factor small subunit
LARVNINFVGPWRLFLGVRSVTVEANSIDEARDYVETNYGPVFQKKLQSRGIKKKQSIWDNSNVLLNGRNIRQLDETVLKDGDNLDLLPRVAGG